MTDCPRCAVLTDELRSIRARIDTLLCDEPKPVLTPNEEWIYRALLAAGARGVSVGWLDENCPEKFQRDGRMAKVFAVYVSKIRRKMGVTITCRGSTNIYERRYFLVSPKSAPAEETLATPAR